MKKIGRFFKSLWANKNSILTILISALCICLATFILLANEVKKVDFFKFMYEPAEYVYATENDVVEAKEAVIAGEEDVREYVPAVYATEEDARDEVPAINVGDVLVPAVLATEEDVSEGRAEEVGQELVPAVVAGELDVREYQPAIVVGQELVPAVEAINVGDILVPAVEAVNVGDIIGVLDYKLNVYGYVIFSIISLGILIYIAYGIVNKYGWEGVDAFAARLQAKRNEVEEKLRVKDAERKAAGEKKSLVSEYKAKLKVFSKGLKELNSKIDIAAAKIKELKVLIDSGLAMGDQIASYNTLQGEIRGYEALKANYTQQISDVKAKI